MRSLLAELDDLADVRALIERTLLDEPPAIVREGGFTRRRRSGARRAQGDQPLGPAGDRRDGGPRTDTDLDLVAQGSLQSRVRGHIEISKANLHLVPADYLRKQTIAGGERFTTQPLKECEESPWRRRAHPRPGARDFRGAAIERGDGSVESPGHGARWPRSMSWPDSPKRRRSPTTPSLIFMRVTSSSSPTADTLSSSGSRTRSSRTTSISTARAASCRADWPQHGRQVDLPAQTALIPLMAQIGSFVPAPCQAAGRGPHLRARRGVGQHCSRAIHLHGRGGDRQHSPYSHLSQSRGSR